MKSERPDQAAAIHKSSPHWAETLMGQKAADVRAQSAAHVRDEALRTQIAALVTTDGAPWMVRLSHELRRLAAAVDSAFGRPLLDVRLGASFSVVARTNDGAFVRFTPRPVAIDLETHVPDLVVTTNSPSEHWRTVCPYSFSLAADALVIDGCGPEAFVRVVCEPWIRTLSIY